jgi:hypothetical protein
MKATSLLLALAIVLGFVSEAGAFSSWIYCNRSIEIGTHRFGFADWSPGSGPPPTPPWTMIYAGPFGEWQVPFSATQGLVGFCILGVGMVALLTSLNVRWKRKSPSSESATMRG